jgi:hypothetical protein
MRYFSILLTAATIVLLSACGGSSDVTAPEVQPLPAPLKVNAGANVSVNEGQNVTLLGGSSGGQGAPTFAWTLSGNAEITHADTSLTNATFAAPSVTQTTVLLVTLTATDTAGATLSDTINITVNPVNLLPTALIQANQISGYNMNEFPLASVIVLDGSGSSDEDPQTSQAPIAAYNWQQIAGPNLMAGVSSTGSTLRLVAPALNDKQQAVFRLTVTDQEQAISSVDYTLTLLSQAQTNIDLLASPMRSVFSGELTILEASASSIAPDAAPFFAMWEQVSPSGEQATLAATNIAIVQDATAFITSAITPVVAANTTINYQVSATDSFRNIATAQAQGVVYAPLARVINDTGVLMFASSNEYSVFHQTDYPGQDASYGGDRQVASGTISKMGEGEQGFDFTRLDAQGNPSDNAIFACARDNVTGLVWQVKDDQDTTSLNYIEQSFTWYSESDNGNFAGALNSGSIACNVQSQACNTQAYIDAINTQGLCGVFDWRLPSLLELQSIVHYGKTEPPATDTGFFPFLGTSNNEPLWYWTQQSSAEGVANDIARNAWAYDMNSGGDGFLDKTSQQRVILVRAGR